MKIHLTIVLILIVGLFHPAQSQYIPGYTSSVESSEQLSSIQINALPQKTTRYHYSETERQMVGEDAFLDVSIEDEFTLEPVFFSEGQYGLKFRQGSAMWKRIFLMEDYLPPQWNQEAWPEILLSIDLKTGKMTMENEDIIRHVLVDRFAELDEKLNSIDSLKNLTFVVKQLRSMLKDNESLTFWLTQPIQYMQHGQLIEVPTFREADITRIFINPETSDTIWRTYTLKRTQEDMNRIRYTRTGNHEFFLPGHIKAANNQTPVPSTTTEESWLLGSEGEFIEVSRLRMTTSNSQVHSFDINRSIGIMRMDE